MVGYRPELISDELGLRPLAEDRAVLVDARDLDPAEADYLATSGIRRSTVDGLTVRSLPTGPLLLHLDLDVVDGGELLGLRYPVPHGPGTAAVLAAARRIVETGRVVAVDLACTWHPGQDDPDGVRARLISGLLAAAADRARPRAPRRTGRADRVLC
jgi:arginase